MVGSSVRFSPVFSKWTSAAWTFTIYGWRTTLVSCTQRSPIGTSRPSRNTYWPLSIRSISWCPKATFIFRQAFLRIATFQCPTYPTVWLIFLEWFLLPPQLHPWCFGAKSSTAKNCYKPVRQYCTSTSPKFKSNYRSCPLNFSVFALLFSFNSPVYAATLALTSLKALALLESVSFGVLSNSS